MTQYIEATNEGLMTAMENMVNAHLDKVTCFEVVETIKHLTEDKWLFNYDLFLNHVATNRVAERTQQIAQYISENADIYSQNYDSLVEAGYEL